MTAASESNVPEGIKPPAPRSKRRVLIEIAVAYGLILAVIWTPRPWQRGLWWIAAASVVAIASMSWDGARPMGLRPAKFFSSAWIVGAALGIAGIAIAIAARLHTLRLPPGPIPFIVSYFAYAIWALAQQFLLQSFFLLRFTRIFSSSLWAAIAAAAIFALAHLPNPILTPITLIWGVAACLLFLRYRNLYALAIAHAIIGITIAITVPGPVDHNMRVGLSYLTYSHRGHRLPAR
jgi:membrane protease YdiL (CAAX protease family)